MTTVYIFNAEWLNTLIPRYLQELEQERLQNGEEQMPCALLWGKAVMMRICEFGGVK